MTPLLVLIAAAAIGVEAGWEPLPGGGHQYTVQIEPTIVGMLQNGNDLESDVPAHVNVRRLRIKIGSGALARIDGPEVESPPTDEAVVANPQAGPAMPAEFQAHEATAEPLPEQPAGFTDAAATHKAQKPQLDAAPGEPTRPWMPLVIAAVLLCCSLGANLYLGWIAWDARARYRDTVSKMRAA